MGRGLDGVWLYLEKQKNAIMSVVRFDPAWNETRIVTFPSDHDAIEVYLDEIRSAIKNNEGTAIMLRNDSCIVSSFVMNKRV